MNKLSRREFLEKAALASGGCLTILLLGPRAGAGSAAPALGENPLEELGYELEENPPQETNGT